MNKLPDYFYNIDHPVRWYDKFSSESDAIWQPRELDLDYQKERRERNEAYSRWMASLFTRGPNGEIVPYIKPKMFKWQAIRVLSFKHSESSKRDWWEEFQDCVFRVFVQPETVYDGKDHKQWYLLCPEDTYLIKRYRLERNGPTLKSRDYAGDEKYLSADKRLRGGLAIPVECCHHMRHETTGGALPQGL